MPGTTWNSETTSVWFTTQAGINADAIDAGYEIYYRDWSGNTAKEDHTQVFRLFDNFDRDNSTTVDGWTEHQVATGNEVDIYLDELRFETTGNEPNDPGVDRTFTAIDAGRWEWRFALNWEQTGGDSEACRR